MKGKVDYHLVLGRIFYLYKTVVKAQKQMSKNEASKIVASGIISDWISKNVYSIQNKNKPKTIRKVCWPQLNTWNLCRTKVHRWIVVDRRVTNFNIAMKEDAYNIRTKNTDLHKSLEAQHEVKMTLEDKDFYAENCHGPYKFTCASTAPKDWTMSQKK